MKCCLLLLALLASPVFAIPQLISLDGYLTNSTGSARNGSFSFNFTLYSASGSALWTETQTLTVSSGKLNALLGSVSALTLPFDQDYYLGINVNADGEMSPRYRIASSAYAYTANTANTAKALAPGNVNITGDANITGDFNYGCPNTSTNQMVKAGYFCIDKYEAYLVSGSLGNVNGNDTTAVAGSKPGVDPLASITWFQAQQACSNAGKRLCTNGEWQNAVAGTPDPGAIGSSTSCNVASNAGTGPYADASGTPANTGAHSSCVSRWGAYDMVGNVWEWTADWATEPGWNGVVSYWPVDKGSDGYWHGGKQDSTEPARGLDGSYKTYGDGAESHMPAAFIRGGSWDTGANAGSFALYVSNAPSPPGASIGLRCCK